ncbi:hypothetical protein SLEP1_g52348 [Rubroshorea leprosula]|uniref:Uncharacterized protein n=1 Tax=Rubroshorea leprosula TaxID=152421 RepID=A0AAV5M7Q8_9ROSI|nr:hypothetical protein SLEP1_g52348 [Rubroshorea leprosula]
MDDFLNAAGGLAIPKKPRKKSKTSNVADKGATEKERLSSTSARALEMQQRPEPMRRSNEEVSEEVAPLQRKKRKVAEPEARRDEAVEFVPRPPPVEVDPEVRERDEVEERGPGKGKELIPPPSFQKSLFDATNITEAKRFLKLFQRWIGGRRGKRHWVNALVQEYAESVRDRASLQRQCEELQKEKEELQKKNKEMQGKLDELDAQDKYIEKMNQGMVELKKNVELLVHNGMEEHIGNFLNSSIFENIINFYRLPTVILTFTDCRKKVKAQYPEVDVTTVTFGEQEKGVEEDGESLSADFRPLIKLRWERDAEGRTIFPPAFDAELVAVEEEEGGQDAELAPPEAKAPPLPVGDEPPQPPLLVEEQPPLSAD